MINLRSKANTVLFGADTNPHVLVPDITLRKNLIARGDLIVTQLVVRQDMPADVGSQSIDVQLNFDGSLIFSGGWPAIPTADTPGMFTMYNALLVGNDGYIYQQFMVYETAHLPTVLGGFVFGGLDNFTPGGGGFSANGALDTSTLHASGGGFNRAPLLLDRSIDHTIGYTANFHEVQPAASIQLIACNVYWYQPDRVN